MVATDARAAGIRIRVRGLVQGVGFRPWVYGLAEAAGIRGRVWNDPGGVTIEAFGDTRGLDAFLDQLTRPPMPAARVRAVSTSPLAGDPPAAFDIVESRSDAERRPAIPADLATCPDCLRELRDPADRRFGHPFVNCTRCGPRYTICTDVPYDRARTTMAEFPLCPACRREYDDPHDRRFHAQPVACPDCGPRLRLLNAHGAPLDGDPVAGAAACLREGGIVAVKGLGGHHLACDAADPEAVATLRARKHRDAKPFAVMVPDLAAADALAQLDDADRALLEDPRRPIVLATRRPGAALAPAVAPQLPLVGLVLPYTALHVLLLAAAGRPLVMTSGNRSDEPMACDDADALARLAGIADRFLLHDRAIANRADDSVARVIDGAPVVLRRGRGWVPGAIAVAHGFPRTVLATGAHLKNACCVGADDRAWMGPHVGDLETHEACLGFEAAVERFVRFVGAAPEVVAHDLHPDYFTTVWAARQEGLPRIAVQHHHAHVVAAMAEHGLEGPVLGLAWDGTGLGTDGTAWGGELLLATAADFRRLATFHPVALAGGDAAIREPWRLALAALDDAFDGAPPLDRLGLFGAVAPERVALVRAQLRAGLNTPRAHGVGRWYDVFGALLLATPAARYEGELALRLGCTAVDGLAPYPVALDAAGVLGVVDPRPALRAAVGDLLAGLPVPLVAGRVQATMIAAGAAMVRHATRAVGRFPVVLTGGCFQNPALAAGIAVALRGGAHDVRLHAEVPPNDGGIALGQAVVAAARLRGERGIGGDA